jgi:hypothetical protein
MEKELDTDFGFNIEDERSSGGKKIIESDEAFLKRFMDVDTEFATSRELKLTDKMLEAVANIVEIYGTKSALTDPKNARLTLMAIERGGSLTNDLVNRRQKQNDGSNAQANAEAILSTIQEISKYRNDTVYAHIIPPRLDVQQIEKIVGPIRPVAGETTIGEDILNPEEFL